MSSSLKTNTSGIYDIPSANVGTLYIKGKKFQEYLEDITSPLTEAEVIEVKSLLEYLDITGLNTAWTVANNNVNETLRSAITALQTKTANLDTTGLTSPSILTDANKNSALKTAIDTLITDLTALAVRVTTEEGNVDNLQTKTAFLDTTALSQTSVLTNDNRNSVLKTAIDALANTPGDVTALAARVTTAEGDIDALEGRATSLEGRATSLEGRATAVENRASTLEGKTRFTTVSNTYFDNNIGTAQPYGIPFGDYDGNTYPIGSFKMEVGPTLNQAGQGKSYFEMTHKNLVQNPNFPAGDIAQASFSDLLRCAGIRSYYRKGATPGIYNLSNETFLQHTDENGDGRVTVKAKVIRVLSPDTNSIVEIGRLTEGWSNPDIRIGGRGNQINIGSMQDDELAQGTGDVGTKTRIYIGRRPTTGNAGDVLNSQLILRGDVWTGNLNWKDLAITSPISLETLIALLSPSGLPSFLFSSLFGGGLAIPKSDVVVMKGTLSKRGDIETSNALSIEKMSIINTSVGNLMDGFTQFYAQHNVSCTQLIGNNRTGVFQGEISLKNYNVVSTGVDFAFAEANDKVNVLSIKGDSGILLHQGASSDNQSLDIFNSKSGPIRLFIGQDGTRAGTTHGGAYIMRYLEPFGNNLVATGETKVILGSKIGIDSALASEAYQGDGFGQGKVATDAQLVIEPSTKVDTLRRQGINVRHKTIVNNLPVYTQSIINSDSISTPSVEAESLKITANYGGSTTNRLYKDANNKLYWNGEQFSAVNYPLGAPTNQNVSNTYIDKSFNLYGNSDAGFPKQSALPTALYTGTPIRTASTQAELTSAISSAGDYDVIRITANITLTAGITIAKKLKIEGTSNAIVVTYSTTGAIFTITNSEVWFSALTFNNANTDSNATILAFSSSSAIKNYVTGCIFQTNEFAISTNNNNIQITDNIFEFVGSPDSHRYIILTGCLGSCFINNNTFRGNGAQPTANTQCVNINNASASAFLNGKIIISGNVSATNPVQRLLMVDIALTASNVSFYVSRNVMTTASGFIILFVSPFDGIKEFYVVQNTETLASGVTGGKGIIGLDGSGTISFNTIVYSSGNSPGVLRTGAGVYTNLVNPSANQNGVIAYSSVFTPGATTYNVIVPFLINLDAIVPETQNLGAVMALGNTASTTLNMNNNGITNVASIQGWNVQEITPGTNISAISSFGNYTIANTAPVQNVLAGSGGISIAYNGTTATISHIGIGGGGGSQSIHDLNALEEVGAFQQHSTWATNFTITDNAVNSHYDMYCSVDGKVIASASLTQTSQAGPVRYSTDYGITWNNGNWTAQWISITGTSSGSKLFATASGTPYSYYTSTNAGASWTNHNINSVTNQSPAPILHRIRASGDGTHLIMCDGSNQSSVGGRIFVSANGGNSWTAKYISTPESGYSTTCAMSRSGRYQYAIFYKAGYTEINRSEDFGVSWSPIYNDSALYPTDSAYFNKIECDSTGRYVYATRVHISNATVNVPMYRSADFGANWTALVAVSMADVWVSGTGQFVVGVSVPLGGLNGTQTRYSIDFGRTFSGGIISNNSIRCIVGSGDGRTLALGSLNITDFGAAGDGYIRVARQNPFEIVTSGLNENAMINGIMNITPNQQLWARGEKYAGAGDNWDFYCEFNGAAKINLSEYNIGYKVEFYWAPGTTHPSHWNHLGINNYTAQQPGYNQGSNGGFTAVTNMQNLHYPTGGDYNWSFNGRSYCGFQQNISSTGLQYRHSSILTGTLSMNHRPENAPAYGGLPASGGTLTTNDWGVFSRVLKNDFVCDNFTCITANSNSPYDWGILAPSPVDYPFSYCSVRGQSVWDMTYGGIYYAGGSQSIQNGVFRLFVRNADNLGLFNNIDNTPANRPRTCYFKYQIYRIRK